MKDWKIIFNTKSYNYIFIKQLKDNNYLKYYFDNIDEIKNEKSFFILMPSSLEEINIQDSNFFVKKYANDLKFFIDSEETTTLFTEEEILKSIIKEDKRDNFFKLLTKKKKNIVLFCNKDLDYSANPDNITSIYMNYEDLLLQDSLFERFDYIKFAIKNTYNPFKDPFDAFEKIQKDN
jgi:hypothetical protein